MTSAADRNYWRHISMHNNIGAANSTDHGEVVAPPTPTVFVTPAAKAPVTPTTASTLIPPATTPSSCSRRRGYNLGSAIGVGTHGTVYNCVHCPTMRALAVSTDAFACFQHYPGVLPASHKHHTHTYPLALVVP